MWVHHHTHKQPTQDIHPPSTTTTNTAANQQPQPPTTNNQLGDQASNLTKSSQARLARVHYRRPCAWVGSFGLHLGQRQLASQPASQPATMGSGSTSAETRNTSPSRPANKHDHSQLVHQIPQARRYLACGNYWITRTA